LLCRKLGLDVVPRGVHGIHIKTDEMSPVDVYLIHNSSIFNGAKVWLYSTLYHA